MKHNMFNINQNNDLKQMKVSIIIPVYNAGKYLAKCIESSLNQTYKNIEIIVICDGVIGRQFFA